MKKVRMLLRVSSNQQLEADGDLSVQRELVKDYVKKHNDWELDSKEYFEEVTADIKILSQTEMYFKKPYKTQKEKNMIF